MAGRARAHAASEDDQTSRLSPSCRICFRSSPTTPRCFPSVFAALRRGLIVCIGMAATEASGTPLAGNINVALGRNDLPTATLLHPASGASCEVILTGAHVTSWKTADGVERLFVSSASKFGDGAAIRGGIPVCWPQFSGRGSLPKHGFVRTSSEWEIAEMVSDEGATKLVLCIKDSEATRAVWPHAFELRYAITLTGEALSTAMELTNTGAEPLTFASALHTYFAVPDGGRERRHRGGQRGGHRGRGRPCLP